MEQLRNEARKVLQKPRISFIPDLALGSIVISDGVDRLWREISMNYGSDKSATCEGLLVAQGFLRIFGKGPLIEIDQTAVENLFNWASELAIPSPVFAESFEKSSSQLQYQSRQICTLAVWVISALASLVPIEATPAAQNIVVALASFTSQDDAWTTHDAWSSATTLLERFTADTKSSSFWNILESILKSQIKPLFAKAKNPAITASGRKNLHPIPLPRFDLSVLDPETKPWKLHGGHITRVFAWIVEQYQISDRVYLETHFPLLVPPILALIDDESVPFRRRGCILLTQLLNSIRKSKSDILRRTNLSSVFEDAIRPCFHSLPTITPEDDSIQLLEAAYPALRSLLQTSYKPVILSANRGSLVSSKEEEIFLSTTIKTLRDHLIPSFHHTSSTNTASDSTFASFPHPRLSTLLLNQITATCVDLGPHTTKYLQDVIPLLYSTLSNPFGPAHPPLLLSAISAARTLILTAHPRIWIWRGELLGAICSCWVHIMEEQDDVKIDRARSIPTSFSEKERTVVLQRLQKEIQGVAYLLRYTLENPANPDGDPGQLEAQNSIAKEIQMLVSADNMLKDCLLHNMNTDDPTYFGLDSK